MSDSKENTTKEEPPSVGQDAIPSDPSTSPSPEKAQTPPPPPQEQEVVEDTIDPANEVTGLKLGLIHTGVCLFTFLVGLVSKSKMLTTVKYETPRKNNVIGKRGLVVLTYEICVL
jgi:hypothetical protein